MAAAMPELHHSAARVAVPLRSAAICLSAVAFLGCGGRLGEEAQQGAQQEVYERCLQEAERAGDGPVGQAAEAAARQGCESLAPQGE